MNLKTLLLRLYKVSFIVTPNRLRRLCHKSLFLVREVIDFSSQISFVIYFINNNRFCFCITPRAPSESPSVPTSSLSFLLDFLSFESFYTSNQNLETVLFDPLLPNFGFVLLFLYSHPFPVLLISRPLHKSYLLF